MILTLLRAEIAERGMQSALIENLVDEAQKILSEVLEILRFGG